MSKRTTPFTASLHVPHSTRVRRMYEFLQSQHVGMLAMTTPSDKPHGAVVYYVIDENLHIHLLTKLRTRTYACLQSNKHVTLTVYDPHTLTTAQVIGEMLPNKDIQAIGDRIIAKVAPTPKTHDQSATPAKLAHFAAFTILPLQIRLAVFSRPEPGDFDELFESTESFELGDDA